MRISDWSSDVCSSDLAFEIRSIANRADVDQRTRKERADRADVDGETALDLAGDDADDRLFALEGLREAPPGLDALGLLFREFGFAERSEVRRVGKECVSTGRFRWSQYH